MKISKRLQMVTKMAAPGAFAVDVGCDHGYTAITLVEEKKCAGAVASDVREGPLRAAAANISRAGLSGRIRTVLADGIPENPENYLPADMPAFLVVTGMGGQLILRILREAGSGLLRFSEMILGPQSEIPMVRRELPALGFWIADEQMVEEDGKFYVLIKARRREPNSEKTASGLFSDPDVDRGELSEESGRGRAFETQPSEALCLAFGRPLLLRKDPVLAGFLRRRRGILLRIEDELLAGGQEETGRMAEVREEKLLVEKAMAFVAAFPDSGRLSV